MELFWLGAVMRAGGALRLEQESVGQGFRMVLGAKSFPADPMYLELWSRKTHFCCDPDSQLDHNDEFGPKRTLNP